MQPCYATIKTLTFLKSLNKLYKTEGFYRTTFKASNKTLYLLDIVYCHCFCFIVPYSVMASELPYVPLASFDFANSLIFNRLTII